MGKIILLYSYMERLAKTGRLKNMRRQKELRARNVAENLIKGGYDMRIVWNGSHRAAAPSTTNDTIYQVDMHYQMKVCQMKGRWPFKGTRTLI